MRSVQKWIAIVVLASALSACSSRLTAQTNRPVSDPYAGTTDIFEYPGRDQRLQIDRVMNELGMRQGSTVADIGAGGGWFTIRAARRVGAKGRVYAVEINQKYLDTIAGRAKRAGYQNVQTVLGTAGDPKLPPGTVDAALILKAYHEVADPVGLLKKTRQSLKADGLLGIIDRNGRGNDHGLDQAVVVQEAKAAGFDLVKTFDFVKPDEEDYFLIFRVSTPAKAALVP